MLFIRNFGVEADVKSLSWQLPENFTADQIIVDGKNTGWKNGDSLPPFEYFVLIRAQKQLPEN